MKMPWVGNPDKDEYLNTKNHHSRKAAQNPRSLFEKAIVVSDQHHDHAQGQNDRKAYDGR